MHLYKYCPWKANKHIINDLKNSILYFQKPELLNDPFDAVPSPGLTADKSLSGRAPSGLLIQSITNNIGICSFTTDPKSLVMWAHYADKHKGICLCFDFPDDRSIILPAPGWNSRQKAANILVKPQRVTYVRSRANTDYLSGDNLIGFFLTKYQAWRYEKEYRAFIMEDYGGFNYNPKYLTGIIAGCKIPDKDFFKLRETVKDLPSSVNLFITVPEHNAFRLDIRAI